MTKDDLQKVRDALVNCAAIGDPHFSNKYEALVILDAALARDDKPVAWVGLTDAETNEFVDALIEYGVGLVAPLYTTVAAIESALRAKNAHPPEDAKDAARYRWLRDKARGGKLIRQIEDFGLDDEWVDAAMQEVKP